MISFRYHVVSLVAAFLALALGIVIGTTALNGPVTSDLRRQVNDVKADRSRLAQQVRTLQGQVDTAGQFATTFSPQVLAGSLKQKPVLVVAMPGVPSGMLDGVSQGLTAAGATLTGKLQLAQSYVDPSQGDSIQGLATGPAHPMSLNLPPTSDARVLGAAMLSYVLVGKGESSDLTTVLSGLSGLHMIASDPSGIKPSTTVVVVAAGSLPRNAYAGQAELDVVSQLAAAGGKVVVAGDSGSATGNGVVALARAGQVKSSVSTVDNADTPFGQVSTALAVAGVLASQNGQYGTAKGAQALFPSRPS